MAESVTFCCSVTGAEEAKSTYRQLPLLRGAGRPTGTCSADVSTQAPPTPVSRRGAVAAGAASSSPVGRVGILSRGEVTSRWPRHSAASGSDAHVRSPPPGSKPTVSRSEVFGRGLRRPSLRWHRTRRVGIITLDSQKPAPQDQEAPRQPVTNSQETQQAVSVSTATRRGKPLRTAKIRNGPHPH